MVFKYADTVPATSLRKVWLQNVATGGFLSVRDGEGWTYSGKLWTRDDQGRPAGAYSWECFDIQVYVYPIKRVPFFFRCFRKFLKKISESLLLTCWFD